VASHSPTVASCLEAVGSADDDGGAVGVAIGQKSAEGHVDTCLAAAVHDAHEVSTRPCHHAGRCCEGLVGRDRAGGHSVGDFACASAGVAVDAGSS
jgi:hypothetical protein